jgi:excisionase family DNA binding protein
MASMCQSCDMRPADGTSDLPELLTPAQVAHLFHVSRSTISRWTYDGILVGLRVGSNVVRYRRADIEAMLTKDAS